MKIEAIERLARRLEGSGIAEVTLCDETGSLTLRFAQGRASAAAVVPAVLAPVPPPPRVLKAPAIGLLRLRHPEAGNAAAPAFPRAVVAGEIIAFLDTGLLLRPIVAETAGTIGDPLLPEGSLVGYGAPIFPLL